MALSVQAWLHDAFVTAGWLLLALLVREGLLFPLSLCGALIGLSKVPWRVLWKEGKPVFKQLYEAYQALSTIHTIAWLFRPRRKR